jgi:Surface adhesin CshA repetitive domain
MQRLRLQHSALKHSALAALLACSLIACPASIEPDPVPASSTPATNPGTPSNAASTVAPVIRTSSNGEPVKINPAQNQTQNQTGPKLDASSIDLNPSKVGQQLVFADTTGKGVFNLEHSSGTVTFTPNPDLNGEARAEYTISTVTGQVLKPATITVVINTPPVQPAPGPVTPGPVTPGPVTPGPVTPGPVIKTSLKVLFIGNSRTRYFDIPKQIKQLANLEIRKLEVRTVAFDGWTLESHWNSQNSAALQAIREGGWDDVVLQELSSRPVLENAKFVTSVKNFNTEINKVGARTVLYENWWRKDLTYSQAQLSAAYKTVADEIGAAISPVGSAWLEASSTNPTSILFDPDGNHATALGAYLAACEFYAFFYEKTPKGLANLGVVGDTAGLQNTAWQTFTKLEGKYHNTPALVQ